jgi:predicted ATP-grasp superfamily ATP-dependent carboligase
LVELIDFLPDVLSIAALRWNSPNVQGTGWAATDAIRAVDSVAVSTPQELPPVLLTTANYNGTLAAVRNLGRAGIRVTTADPARFAVSAWSKYVSTRVQCPPVRDSGRFLDWLFAFGAANDKHVLLPTSDDTAWLYSLHRERLAQHFHIASPPIDVVYGLLNKATMYEDAVLAGLNVPRTWFPNGVNDLERCKREARFPVVIKPRTQVLFRTQSKGAYVQTPEDLDRYYAVIADQPHEPDLLRLDACASLPMVQEFHAEAARGIYNISAYVHRGHVCGLRAARKLLQQPRRLGIGVCFEEEAVVPELAQGLERLAARTRFSGVFEAEFIQTDSKHVLIDFNPRFYNQMAFDIARGLPLPLLAYYDAIGDGRLFRDLSSTIAVNPPPVGRVFVDLIALRTLLSVQRLSGVLSREEKQHWTDWYKSNRDRCTYAYVDSADRLPVWLAGIQLALRYARHPRNFMRSIVFNQH